MVRPRLGQTLAALAALVACGVLISLGTWQLRRGAWKAALIARVQANAHALIVAAPSIETWARSDPLTWDYRRVEATGHYLEGRPALVRASTALGPGYWVMVPLQRADGGIVLINRGLIATDHRETFERADAASRDAHAAEAVTVTGLLRLPEPNGFWPRSNSPASERWFSRDIPSIAAARGLADVAPYFIDADASPAPSGEPIGGLTVLAFPDNHLLYAVTWYALALLLAGGTIVGLRTKSLNE